MAISLKKELEKLKIYTISNEKLYKFSEFEEKLKLIYSDTFESDNFILTPYYIDNNKIYELYAYELNVHIVDEIDFESHIKKLTGKKRIEDIADEIVDNYAGDVTKFTLKGGDGVNHSLYQLEGSLNGKKGIFEWIVDPDPAKGVTHRRFIENVGITGKPNARP